MIRRRMRVAGVALVALALAGCASADGVAGQVGDAGYIAGDGIVTEIAPDQRAEPAAFAGPLVDGGEFDSAELDGVTLVNFWYAACPPCRVEAPVLAELHAELGDRVDFLGVNTRDGAAQAAAFEEQFGIEYPSILDADDVSVQLAFANAGMPPNAVPTTFLLDREGRIAGRISGLIRDPSILAAMIDRVLEER